MNFWTLKNLKILTINQTSVYDHHLISYCEDNVRPTVHITSCGTANVLIETTGLCMHRYFSLWHEWSLATIVVMQSTAYWEYRLISWGLLHCGQNAVQYETTISQKRAVRVLHHQILTQLAINKSSSISSAEPNPASRNGTTALWWLCIPMHLIRYNSIQESPYLDCRHIFLHKELGNTADLLES